MTTPNEAWASGLTTNHDREGRRMHRSTSQEYEGVRHRLGPDVPRKSSSKSSTRRNPEGKKSPVDQVIDVAKRALAPATIYMLQRPTDSDQPLTNGANGSYDYSNEEREYQAAQNPAHGSPRRISAASKRNRMSLDNKAYYPSKSDSDDSEEEDDDKKGRRRRRKKKNEPLGGPLTSLPVTSYDKRKKRSKKTNATGGEEESGSEGQISDQVSGSKVLCGC
jgi:SUN domain-containing protein 1/2